MGIVHKLQQTLNTDIYAVNGDTLQIPIPETSYNSNMPRVGTLGSPKPYEFFGTYAGISFWPGGLTLLAAAPGVGKTSWLLRMLFEGADDGIPSAIGCYEHTAEELKYRLSCQGGVQK